LNNFVFVYIDDIIIFTNGFLQNHRNQVLRIVKKLKNAGLQLNIDKCEFKQKKVQYLGYIINSEKGICVDPEKVEAIRTLGTSIYSKGGAWILGLRKLLSRVYSSVFEHCSTFNKPYEKGRPVPMERRRTESVPIPEGVAN
jgi:hypothetical protein